MYGFVFNYGGGSYTHCGQINSAALTPQLKDAVLEMLEKLGFPLSDPYELEQLEQLEQELVALPDGKGVWTATALLNDQLFEVYLFLQ